jgi:hypothetical protein
MTDAKQRMPLSQAEWAQELCDNLNINVLLESLESDNLTHEQRASHLRRLREILQERERRRAPRVGGTPPA